jgi:hypothetical protein
MTFSASLQGWEGYASKDLRESMIVPIPTSGACAVVTIDGKPYAGFVSREYAEEAVRLWTGLTNGCGFPVPVNQRDRSGWIAVRGRILDIILM